MAEQIWRKFGNRQQGMAARQAAEQQLPIPPVPALVIPTACRTCSGPVVATYVEQIPDGVVLIAGHPGVPDGEYEKWRAGVTYGLCEKHTHTQPTEGDSAVLPV